MSPKYDVFISYSSHDRALAEEVANRLREAGLSLFFDRWCLPGGKPWGPLLERSIQESGSCAVLIGREGFGPWQAREMWVALDRQGPDFPVIPTLLPGAEEVPSLFLGLNTWVDMRRGVHDEAAFRVLLRAIRGEAVGGPVFEELAGAVRPYLGLRAFREEDSAFFFGREAFTERLVEAVERTPFLAVVGPSGSGKSSVVQAGLIPALRKGALEGSKAWEFAIFRPGKNPLKQMAASLVSLLEPEMDEVTRLAKVGELADYLKEGQVSLADAAGRILEKRHYATQAAGAERVVLVADQFEELFTYKESELVREIFLSHLLDAAEERDGPLTVVLTLRADFYSHCLGVRPLADRLEGRVINIGPMTEEELGRAVEEPAGSVGVHFEAGLVERFLEDVRGEPGALPLLEFALTELWEKRRGGLLTHQAYEEFDGVGGAIAQRAEREYGRFSEEEKKFAKRIFLNLITPGEETEDVRRRAALAEILPEEPIPADSVRAVVKALADARLITTGREEASGEETVEVAHEALIRGWERLKGWVQEDRAFLEWLKGLRVDLARWKESREFLRGKPLADALDWVRKRGEDLGAEARLFIQASARRERQRRILTLTAVAVVFVLISLAALFAWQRGNEAMSQRATAEAERNIAASRELAAAAIGNLQVDSELSLLLAIEAIETEYTVQADDALRQALASPWRITLHGHTSSVNLAAYSPDGRWIVTAGEDRTARVWEAKSGQQMMVLKHPDRVNSAAYSPNGRWIVTASGDGTARVWDAESGQQKVVLEHTGSVRAVAFSPDGQWIVTASRDGMVRVWPWLDVEDLLVEARSRVARELTCQERVQYLHEDLDCGAEE
jgi:KaiC/GvpD/RAD55 family RecA-like ATPase